MDDAFYLPLGDDRWRSTIHTTGPWDARFQHGGPPSALLARAIEQRSFQLSNADRCGNLNEHTQRKSLMDDCLPDVEHADVILSKDAGDSGGQPRPVRTGEVDEDGLGERS